MTLLLTPAAARFLAEMQLTAARAADPDWLRSLRDQCQGHIPFYLKDHPGTIDGVQYREIPEGMAL